MAVAKLQPWHAQLLLHTVEQTNTWIGGTHAHFVSTLFVGPPQYSLARGIIQCLIDLHLWQLRSFLYLSFVRTGRSKPKSWIKVFFQETLVAEICRFSQHSLCNLVQFLLPNGQIHIFPSVPTEDCQSWGDGSRTEG